MESRFNDTNCSRHEEQLDDGFSETSPTIDQPTSIKIKKSQLREKQKEPTVSNIDKLIEHLNKKQKVTSGALDAVEMLMMSHAKTIKTFSPKRQAIAKKQISEINGNLEIDQIEENEYLINNSGSLQPIYQTVQDGYHNNQHVDDSQTKRPVAYPTYSSEVINLSVENSTPNYTWP